MNVTSGGPHILLFERDQQLTALLSGELGLAGYEVHTSRTAVEVFDAIARFPVRLVLVDLAQAQAGRREFWIALDAQRRGRGVQVFTFRCSNVGGYGPDDPEEHIQTVATDLEVDGMHGIVRLVESVRARVPGSITASAPARPAPLPEPPPELPQIRRAPEMPLSPSYTAQGNAVTLHGAQPLHASLRPQETSVPAIRPAEPPRSGPSTFTDKIRAVIYPSSRSYSQAPEPFWPEPTALSPVQNSVQYQSPDVQARPQASQRFVEATYTSATNREEMLYQAPNPAQPSGQHAYLTQNGMAQNGMAQNGSTYPANTRAVNEESGLDQLSRLLRESHPGASLNGNMQNSAVHPGLSVDQQELQELRAQLMQAAREDEAYGRGSINQSQRPAEVSGLSGQLRAAPIQDVPFEREVENRRNGNSGPISMPTEGFNRPAMTVMQPTQTIPPVQETPVQFAPAQMQSAEPRTYPPASSVQGRSFLPMREALPDTSMATPAGSQVRQVQEPTSLPGMRDPQVSGPLNLNGDEALAEQVRVNLQQTLSQRPQVKTSDDTLLDIVKSLPPMAPAPQPPQTQVLSGRATRSLGSVLLEGHLVPQERLQVAQHVQRMLRGVDLNYQLGEILLMFKLLTPDQLLAASLVSYGTISTVQITALGRVRQELHAIGLEYDLESLLVLFRILTPEQLREVRATWSS